ncbi:MAG: 4Fe-4S binding protein [Endomicrobiales bacterium]|jgi:2-oxoglutarate ferredoxin oxidoreductase subunit delta
MEKVIIDVDKCKGCRLCIEVCQKKCLIISETFNKAGYRPAVFQDTNGCTSCGFCYQICPDVAIEIYK